MNKRTGARRLRQAGLLLAVCLVAGCSGIRPYPDTMAGNMHVRTETESGSAFSRVRAAIDIYRVGEDCGTEYAGTVDLKGPGVDVGIPTDTPSYLVFAFSTSSLLAGRSSMSTGGVFKPRAGYDYEVSVSYMEDMYDVRIRESSPRGSALREVELRDLSECETL